MVHIYPTTQIYNNNAPLCNRWIDFSKAKKKKEKKNTGKGNDKINGFRLHCYIYVYIPEIIYQSEYIL